MEDGAIWASVRGRLTRGKLLKDGTYRVLFTDDKRARLERLKTGSTVTISRRMVEKTAALLSSGVFIERRTISYTVAIETGVVAALGALIRETTKDGKRGYLGGAA